MTAATKKKSDVVRFTERSAMKRVQVVCVGLALVVGVSMVSSAQDTTTMLTMFLNSLRAGYLAINASTGAVTFTGTLSRASVWMIDAGGYRTGNLAKLAFSQSSDPNDTLDAGVARAAAGIVEINNGTIGAGGMLVPGRATQATLGTPANGAIVYCSDCTIANPCAGGGSGALAKRLNATWICN